MTSKNYDFAYAPDISEFVTRLSPAQWSIITKAQGINAPTKAFSLLREPDGKGKEILELAKQYGNQFEVIGTLINGINDRSITIPDGLIEPSAQSESAEIKEA